MAKFQKILLVFCLAFSLVSCKKETYTVSDYLCVLADKTGIIKTENNEEAFHALLKWGVLSKEDIRLLDEPLTYEFLKRSLTVFLEKKPLDDLIDEKGIAIKNSSSISKEEALTIIDSVVEMMNQKDLIPEYEVDYKEEIKEVTNREELDLTYDGIVYIKEENAYYHIEEGELKECSFEEIFDKFNIAESFEVDFFDAEIEMYGEEEKMLYQNENYELLASTSKVFNIEGFRVSYSLGTSSLSFRISKSIKDGITTYGDLSLTSIEPSVEFHFEDKKLQDASLLIDYKSTGRLGFSTSRYRKLALDFKNLDASGFRELAESLIKEKKDALEAVIPICSIKTPIPNIPTASLNMEVLLKLYAGGKAELALYDHNCFGFEIKDGQTRFITQTDHDHDFILRASAKSTLGLNFSVMAAQYRLMDIELDGGIKAEVKTTMHLYEKDGEETSEETEMSYDALDTLAKDNENVDICGDLSLRWLLGLQFNTYRTLLYKYGFTSTKELCDDDDQVFGNLHHIENGQFVEKCTRKSKKKVSSQSVHVSADNILLSTYSVALSCLQSYTVEPVLPDGYTLDDLVFTPSKEGIVSIKDNTITAIKSGAVKIEIATSDKAYKVYLNVLVKYE